MSFLSRYAPPCQKLFCFLGIFLCLVTVQISHATAQGFNSKSFTLKNGMQVVLLENHRAPVVSHMVWYRIGAADEPLGVSGVAHFLEHLMFTGTEKIPPGTYSETIKKHGGQDNAFTSQDYTAYYQNISVDKLPMVMRMEADRMQNLQLTEDIVLRERKVILEERNERTDNNPGALLREAVNSALFANHPYSIPVIGWKHEMEKLSLQDALDFYNAHYRPGNAILIVGGDISLESLKELAEQYYGNLKNPEDTGNKPSPRIWTSPAPLKTDAVITMRDKKVQAPMYQKTYRAPRGDYGMELLSNVLGEGTTSRLYKKLVIEQKIATSVGSSYDPIQYGPGTFTLYAAPAPDVAVERVEKAIDEMLEDIKQTGVTAEELSDAKSRLVNSAIYARDSLQYPAMIFGRVLTAGFEADYVETWTDRIEATTAEEVAKAAETIFAKDKHAVIGILLPEKQALKGQ